MPPAPSALTISYGPSLVPGVSGMRPLSEVGANYIVKQKRAALGGPLGPQIQLTPACPMPAVGKRTLSGVSSYGPVLRRHIWPVLKWPPRRGQKIFFT